MNVHHHTHANHRQIQRENDKTPVKSGLWKLLVAAAFILLALVASLEIFGDTGSDLVAPNPPQQTGSE